METYTIKNVKEIFLDICHICQDNQELFTEADSKLGDGDMGISMGKGASAIEKQLNEMTDTDEDLTKVFLGCAMEFNRAAPSTLGTLISFGMMAAGRELNHKTGITQEEIIKIIRIFADTISQKGKAKTGDKTILDALCPYVEALEKGVEKTGSIRASLPEASKAARAGMESTMGIRAKTGRASWLDARNMDCPDAGAVLCVTVVEGLEKRYAKGYINKG